MFIDSKVLAKALRKESDRLHIEVLEHSVRGLACDDMTASLSSLKTAAIRDTLTTIAGILENLQKEEKDTFDEQLKREIKA